VLGDAAGRPTERERDTARWRIPVVLPLAAQLLACAGSSPPVRLAAQAVRDSKVSQLPVQIGLPGFCNDAIR